MGKNSVSYKALYSDIEKDMKVYKDLIFRQWKDIALSIFKWKNLPDGMLSRHIEETLFIYGRGAFFKDNTRGFLFLPCTQRGDANVYNDPVAWTITGRGYVTQRAAKNAVQVDNSLTTTPSQPFVEMICEELTEINFAKKQNRGAQACPVILSGNTDEILTLKTLFSKIAGFVPAIYKDDKLSIDKGLQAVNLGVPYLGKEFYEDYVNTEQRLLAFLGLNFNPLADKKERLITDEANANKQQTEANLNSKYDARKDAVKAINELFNLDIEVMLNPDIFPEMDETAGEDETYEADENAEEDGK